MTDAGDKGDPKPRDRALVLGQLADQQGLAVLRQRAEGAPVEAGIVRDVREGEPIAGELISLKPTGDDPRVCDVEVHASVNAPGSHKGPARVNSEAFRQGWEQAFRRRDTSDLN